MVHLIQRFFFFLFHNPGVILLRLLEKKWFPITDEAYIKVWYRFNTGRKLDLKNPITFNEKLQWLKLYDHQPVYTTMVDKYAVKEFVSDRIGDKYVIPLLGVWDRPEDIVFDKLPDQFVLKVTHGGGSSGVVICKDKSQLDIAATVKKLSRCMKTDGYIENKEWPYKNVVRRVIAEKYMEDNTFHELRDYKFFCFYGVPKLLYVASGRQMYDEPRFDYFDMDYNHIDLKTVHPNSDPNHLPEKPRQFDEMKRLAAELSRGIPHVRTDFYEVDGKVFFGELTFFHGSGLLSFDPEEWDIRLGEWITLPQDNVIGDGKPRVTI